MSSTPEPVPLSPRDPAPKNGILSSTTQVFLGMLFSYLGLGMVVPIMAPLVLQLGLTELQGGLIFAVNYLLWVLASPFWGARTETWGRKPIILMGLIGFSLGHLLFGLAAELGLHGWLGGGGLLAALIATRALAGGLFSGAPPASQAFVVDTVSARQRTAAVGLLGAAAGIGTVAGPVVTLVTSFVELPLTVPIYLAAAMPLIPAAVIWFLLPAGQSRPRKAPPKLSFWDRRYVSVLGVGLMMNVAFALVLFTLGFYIKQQLGLDEHATAFKSAVAMALVGLVAFFVQAVLLRALRWSPITLMRVGLVVMAVGMLQLTYTMHNEYLVYLAVVVIGAGYSFTYPGFQTAITFTVGTDEQGSVAGLAAGAGAVAFIVGPVLGTWMYGWVWWSPYILSAVLLACTAAFAMFSPGMKKLRRVSKGLEGV
ncbi:MAG: MFS transporter [Myxococcota bacterium]